MLFFAILALLLDIIADLVPEDVAVFIPNAMAMSIGLMMGPGVGIDFVIGGLGIAMWRSL